LAPNPAAAAVTLRHVFFFSSFSFFHMSGGVIHYEAN
jgi:hypothetical protein